MPSIKFHLGEKYLLPFFFYKSKPISKVAYSFNISSESKLFVWGKLHKITAVHIVSHSQL